MPAAAAVNNGSENAQQMNTMIFRLTFVIYSVFIIYESSAHNTDTWSVVVEEIYCCFRISECIEMRAST